MARRDNTPPVVAAPPSSAYHPRMTIYVFTRQGCPLCDTGIALTRGVFDSARIELVDVDLDLALLETYGDRVPVIEDANGVVIDEGIIDESVLRAHVEAER